MRSKRNVDKLPRAQLTAFEMQRRPAAFQRRALQGPVTITSNGQPTIVAMSVAEYLRLRAASPDGIALEAYPPVMDRNEAVTRLKAHRTELAKLGVAHLSLFGSVARNQADDESDVDVIVDSVDGEALGLFALGDIKEQLERILGRDVDVISRRGLNHAVAMKQRVAVDVLDVF